MTTSRGPNSDTSSTIVWLHNHAAWAVAKRGTARDPGDLCPKLIPSGDGHSVVRAADGQSRTWPGSPSSGPLRPAPREARCDSATADALSIGALESQTRAPGQPRVARCHYACPVRRASEDSLVRDTKPRGENIRRRSLVCNVPHACVTAYPQPNGRKNRAASRGPCIEIGSTSRSIPRRSARSQSCQRCSQYVEHPG